MADTEAPTGGTTAGAPPASAPGGTPAPPAGGQAGAPQTPAAGQPAREEMIPRERFDEVNGEAARLRDENARLVAERNANANTNGRPTWAQTPDETIRQVLANPIKYADHHAGALAEWERRIMARATGAATEAVSMDSLKKSHPDAFNPQHALGRELARIIAPNRTQAEIMQDAIELARLRVGKPVNGTPTNSLAANLTSAIETPPGGTGAPALPPPDWKGMSDKEFQQYQSDILMAPREVT